MIGEKGIFFEPDNLVVPEQTSINGITIDFVTPNDCEEISHMVTQNFLKAPSYQGLSQEALRSYLSSNSAESVLKTISHPDNICALLLKDTDKQTIGYHVVREVEHKFDNKSVAGIRRLHISRGYEGRGLGKSLVALSEQLARDRGHSRMVANASGDSHTFFARIGYVKIREIPNRTFSEQGIQTNLVYMEKEL